MDSIHEYIQSLEQFERANEDKLIQMLSDFLDNGGDIDSTFPQNRYAYGNYCGTILHYSIINRCEKVVEYALSKGANIAVEMISKKWRYRNALDVAHNTTDLIAQMLRKRSLELYSSFGLTPFHLDCAFVQFWNSEMHQYVQTNPAQVNAAISTESPIWPGMIPIWIAAKFKRNYTVKHLLNLGADPIARDQKGNTALHYLAYLDFFDDRLFALNARNTFGSFTGESHFHIACKNCPNALHIVKRYLDQGISPDLAMKNVDSEIDCKPRKVGLQLAVERMCPELIRLLLEYGANVNIKASDGRTPIESMEWPSYDDDRQFKYIQCSCLLIEAGSNVDRLDTRRLITHLSENDASSRIFLECIARLTTINDILVSKKLTDVRDKLILEPKDNWRCILRAKTFKSKDETEYVGRCLEELETLTKFGLRNILDGSLVVKPDFMDKFEMLDFFDFDRFPIYGSLLKIRIKQKLNELKEKARKVLQPALCIQTLFKSVCQLPNLCAENIVWNFSIEELDRFAIQSSNDI